jgi:hypothetical protein
MPPLPVSLDQYIIKSKERLNKSNLKVYCKACIEILGQDEGKKFFFPNKTDRIILHFKKCIHFVQKTTPEERREIFGLSKDSDISQTKRKRPSKWQNFYFVSDILHIRLHLIFFSFI